MNEELSVDRVRLASQQLREELRSARDLSGPWIGELASSAVSTATAISACCLVRRGDGDRELLTTLDSLIGAGVNWLLDQQQSNGGWGDTSLSYSNVATTMLGRAALALARDEFPAFQESARWNAAFAQSADYLQRMGGVRAIRQRYGRDKTFAVPILTNAALAGLIPWDDISALPFELAVLPQRLYRWLRLPVVSYAIPALVAIGQVVHHFRPPVNPVTRWLRQWAIHPSLRVLHRIQPLSGGYLEAVPLTSFVVMSLAASGHASLPVTRAGLQFLIQSARADGSWPIDTNLACWNTSLAIHALGGENLNDDEAQSVLHWLLHCQQRSIHPFTGAAPGGWGWTDLSGSVPDADDTPGALLALAQLAQHDAIRKNADHLRQISVAVDLGLRWLLDLQNSDGGWPTFCRGWGTLPFDRSGTDLTAHALRALFAWRDHGHSRRIVRAVERGRNYLRRYQQADGTWLPLWFGNQDRPQEDNPVYGTAKVLLAYRDLSLVNAPEAVRGVAALLALQNVDGGWGGGRAISARSADTLTSSNEETGLAVEALQGWNDRAEVAESINQGVSWILRQIATDRHRNPHPIGFYFAKLWYHEKLYPLTFLTAALRRHETNAKHRTETDHGISSRQARKS